MEVLDHVSQGPNSFVMLSTGYGKTDCFILPPLILDFFYPAIHHISLVVTPMRSLMLTQCSKLKGRGVKSACILPRDELSDADVRENFKPSFSFLLVIIL